MFPELPAPSKVAPLHRHSFAVGSFIVMWLENAYSVGCVGAV